MKFKVGDKVKVKEDLIVDKKYNKCSFIDDMKKYMGKIVTIERTFLNEAFDADRYEIKEDGEVWAWSNDMFEDNLYNEETVNHPSHYNQTGIECIDAISNIIADLKGEQAFDAGNLIKYIWRYKEKNGEEDMKKAKWYLERLINK